VGENRDEWGRRVEVLARVQAAELKLLLGRQRPTEDPGQGWQPLVRRTQRGSRDTWGRQLNGESDEAEPAAGNRLAPTDPGRFRWDRLARSAYDGQDHLARHRDASIHGYYLPGEHPPISGIIDDVGRMDPVTGKLPNILYILFLLSAMGLGSFLTICRGGCGLLRLETTP
jgi:hypothetical protein